MSKDHFVSDYETEICRLLINSRAKFDATNGKFEFQQTPQICMNIDFCSTFHESLKDNRFLMKPKSPGTKSDFAENPLKLQTVSQPIKIILVINVIPTTQEPKN
jgi:hypothetical protein